MGFLNITFHDLRHTYTVMSFRAGDDPVTVQRNLGHATANFTLKVYAHVTRQMKEASAQRMEDYINVLQKQNFVKISSNT
jgi:integrase